MTTAVGYFPADTLSDRGNAGNATKKQPRGKEIIALIRNTIINLCREKYNASVEVDGIICICPVGTSSNHIVKIHQTILPAEDVPYTDYVAPEHMLDRPPDQWPYNMVRNEPSQPPADSELPVTTKKKRKYTRHKKPTSKSATDNSTEKESPKTDNEEDAQTNSETEKKVQDDVSSAKKRKYPLLVHTLCGEDGMYLEPSRPQVSVENVSGGEDISLSDNERQKKIEENTGKSAVASLLSNLMIPTQQVTLQNAGTNEVQHAITPSNVNVQSDKMPSQDIPEALVEQPSEKSSAEENVENVSTLPGGIVIKEEPQWDETETSEYPYTPSHYLHNDSRNVNEETAKSAETTELAEDRSQSQENFPVSDVQIKQEKPDSDSESMETDQYGMPLRTTETEESNKTKQTEVSTSSILMKILKGKSLREAYKSATPHVAENVEETIKKEGSSDLNESSSSTTEDQEQSLVNRLPYATFAELFPGSSQAVSFRSEGGETASHTTGKTAAASQSYDAFDLLARSILQKEDKRKENARYSTRLSSGRKNPVNYTEMLDMGSDLDFTDDDSVTVEKSDGDREFSPLLFLSNNSYSEKDTESSEKLKSPVSATVKPQTPKDAKSQLSMLLQKKTAALTPAYRGPPPLIKSPYSSTAKLMLFSCRICGCEFSSRLERDRHEEEEQYREFVKCPLCNGYFGDDESKRKHMVDRHQVCEKGTVSNTGKTNCLEAPKIAGMLTYHSTQCPICYIFYKTELDRDDHLRNSHDIIAVTEKMINKE